MSADTKTTTAYCNDYGPDRASVIAIKGTDEFARLQSLDCARRLPAGIGIESVPVYARAGDRIWHDGQARGSIRGSHGPDRDTARIAAALRRIGSTDSLKRSQPHSENNEDDQ